MKGQMKKILLSLLAVVIILVGYLVFPDMNAETGGETDKDAVGNVGDVGGTEADGEGGPSDTQSDEETDGYSVVEDGEYLDLDSVAEYIHVFGKLPKNFLTKDEASDLGWESKKGNLWAVAPGSAIGGDIFRNYEGQLPKKTGRVYYECDVNYDGGYRDAERIVFSNDGLIFYTSDHYETFTQLYGE